MKKFKKLPTSNYDTKKIQKFSKLPQKSKRRQSIVQNIPLITNNLKNLLEENEESFQEENNEDIKNISFELNNIDDMVDLLDNFSNKSDDKAEINYESTTKEEGIELIDEFLQQSTKNFIMQKKGFNNDIKTMSHNFYDDLINDLKNIDLINDKNNKINDRKLLKKNLLVKTDSLTSEENNTTFKFKNDLIAQSDTAQSYGKVFSFTSKNKSNSNNHNLEDNEDDKIITIRKKKNEK